MLLETAALVVNFLSVSQNIYHTNTTTLPQQADKL